MNRPVTTLFVALLCAGMSAQPAFSADGSTAFGTTESVDAALLGSLINRKLAEKIKAAGGKLALEQKVVNAANLRLRRPDLKDGTDANGFHLPAVKVLMDKDGLATGSVLDNRSMVKANCSSIRRFNASDTYDAVAARIVANQFDNNRQQILNGDFRFFGVGVYAVRDWERGVGDVPLKQYPKCLWIYMLFVYAQ